MERIVHDLRLSESVSPFGVGAVVDILGESLIAPDTSWWDKKFAHEIVCERLVRSLGGGFLYEAPSHSGRVAKETRHLLYWRFPAWRFCERCSRLSKRTYNKRGKWTNTCECGGKLVPMRYVAVCTKGSHIQDIPWFQWAHRGKTSEITEEIRFCKAYKELRFVSSSKAGEGLASLMVKCLGCKRSRQLSELVIPKSLASDGIKCLGTQPWEDPKSASPCEHPLQAVQRGATGNYLADRYSALDIPEEQPESVTQLTRIREHKFFEKVVEDNGGPQAEMVAGWIADEFGVSVDEVLRAADTTGEPDSSAQIDLKVGEWAAFAQKLDRGGRDEGGGNFVVDAWSVDRYAEWSSMLSNRIKDIGQVRRVREVRALKEFRRSSPDAMPVRVDLTPDRNHKPIYPAIELFGEGIFLRFDENALAEWEADLDVRRRADILIRRRAHEAWAHRLPVPGPRFIALHTTAHLLIRRLAFASGYAAAALQERIYASSDGRDHTAGILIYTAAGDAQGTLGGLVRLGSPDKLMPLLLAALTDADVCSNDPVCIESDRQGSAQLNLSACHGCALISETSCETSNRLLDRQLVLGGQSVPGLLETVLNAARLT
jgi:hypothetical protein